MQNVSANRINVHRKKRVGINLNPRAHHSLIKVRDARKQKLMESHYIRRFI